MRMKQKIIPLLIKPAKIFKENTSQKAIFKQKQKSNTDFSCIEKAFIKNRTYFCLEKKQNEQIKEVKQEFFHLFQQRKIDIGNRMMVNQKNKINEPIDIAEAATNIVETPHNNQEINHALLGGLSGVIVSTILHPLEVIKIGIIINPMKLDLQKSNFAQSFYTVGKHIHTTEGLKGFFRGLAPEVVRSCVGTSMYFYILKELEKIFKSNGGNKDDDKKLTQFTSSAIARMASAYITNPLGVVASRCQVPGFTVYKNMFDGFRKIVKYEGYSSFMRGSLASALKEGPFAGTYYVIYRLMMTPVDKKQNDYHYFLYCLLSGMTAGFIATTVSHPFEIIRARQQIISKFDNNLDYSYNGIGDAFKKIYEHDGMSGYFRGLAPRLVRKPLANALTFTLFELLHHSYSSTKWGEKE